MTQYLRGDEHLVPLSEEEIRAHLVKEDARRMDSKNSTHALRVVAYYYGYTEPVEEADIRMDKESRTVTVYGVEGTGADELAFLGCLTMKHPFAQALYNNDIPGAYYSQAEVKKQLNNPMFFTQALHQFVCSGKAYQGRISIHQPYVFKPLYGIQELSAPVMDVLEE